MNKVDRSRLMAMIALVNEQLDFLGEYGDFCSDYVLCTQESIELIERVEALGKIPIPCCTMETRLGEPKRPKDVKFSENYLKYIEYLDDALQRLPYVLVGCEGIETPGHDWLFHEITHFFETWGNKIIFAGYDHVIEMEANIAFKTGKACPIREFLKQRQSYNFLFTGYWCLYPNRQEMVNQGFHAAEREECFRAFDDCLEYPYEYYKDYLKDSEIFWSGIGREVGAQKHHLSKLVDFGHAGCLFAPSTLDKANYKTNKEKAEIYFTDVENWNG